MAETELVFKRTCNYWIDAGIVGFYDTLNKPLPNSETIGEWGKTIKSHSNIDVNLTSDQLIIKGEENQIELALSYAIERIRTILYDVSTEKQISSPEKDGRTKQMSTVAGEVIASGKQAEYTYFRQEIIKNIGIKNIFLPLKQKKTKLQSKCVFCGQSTNANLALKKAEEVFLGPASRSSPFVEGESSNRCFHSYHKGSKKCWQCGYITFFAPMLLFYRRITIDRDKKDTYYILPYIPGNLKATHNLYRSLSGKRGLARVVGADHTSKNYESYFEQIPKGIPSFTLTFYYDLFERLLPKTGTKLLQSSQNIGLIDNRGAVFQTALFLKRDSGQKSFIMRETTVDQLLMTAFNANKRWSVIIGEVMGGAIIFDEIHAYDGHMLALLERVTRELRDYSKMLFMSATMPKNLIDFLSKLLCIEGESHIVKDTTLLQNARNEYIVNEKTLFEKEKISKKVVDEIEMYIENGKRVAIVCNTVKVAQEAYQQFSNNNLKVKPMCLHSRFIAKDRKKKEKKLEKDKAKSRKDQSWPQILVATQVIECGMDIDYDVLFTEGAPLEAIIQRAGRVNRERSPKKGKVHVFQQDEASTRFYPPEITINGLEILKEKVKSSSDLTEEELVNIIELVYKDKKFENDARFLNTRRVLDELIYDIGAVQDLPETDLHTRFVTYKMVEVVPEKLWDDIKEENQFVIMEHLVKMPLWAYLLAKSNSTNDRWKVMNMLYNDEIGGTFEDNINKRLESKYKYEVLFA